MSFAIDNPGNRTDRPNQIYYISLDTRLGSVLVAATENGICAVSIGDVSSTLVSHLADWFPDSILTPDGEPLREWSQAIIRYFDGEGLHPDVPVDLYGTEYQIRVWQQLQQIPYGNTITYGELADRMGSLSAVRAVAGACARNKVGIVIPCHRLIRSDGSMGGYRWGVERKRKLLEMEKKYAVNAQPGLNHQLSLDL